jgi:hypothetical protein
MFIWGNVAEWAGFIGELVAPPRGILDMRYPCATQIPRLSPSSISMTLSRRMGIEVRRTHLYHCNILMWFSPC